MREVSMMIDGKNYYFRNQTTKQPSEPEWYSYLSRKVIRWDYLGQCNAIPTKFTVCFENIHPTPTTEKGYAYRPAERSFFCRPGARRFWLNVDKS